MEIRQKNTTWKPEELAEILKKHREGARHVDLARITGLSRERIRQVLLLAERKERQGQQKNNPFPDMSTRLRNCLLCENLRSIDAVKQRLSAGDIIEIPNLGIKSCRELTQWLKDK